MLDAFEMLKAIFFMHGIKLYYFYIQPLEFVFCINIGKHVGLQVWF